MHIIIFLFYKTCYLFSLFYLTNILIFHIKKMLKEHNTNHALINTFVSQFIIFFADRNRTPPWFCYLLNKTLFDRSIYLKKQIPIYQTHFMFRLLAYGQEAFLAFRSVNIIFLLSALLFYFVIF